MMYLPKTFTPEEGEAIGRAVLSKVTAPEALVVVDSSAAASARFANNDLRDLNVKNRVAISLNVDFSGKVGNANTNQTDPDSLALLVKNAESAASQHHPVNNVGLRLISQQSFVDPPIYYESSLRASAPDFQGDLVRNAASIIKSAGLTGSGDLTLETSSRTILSTTGLNAYTRNTYGDYSATARTVTHTGSGWAWGGHEDFSKVDPIRITEKAIDIAKRSDKPIAVEPGRYTVILEPEAVATLVAIITGLPTDAFSMAAADNAETVFSLIENNMPKGNKIGLRMADRRMQMYQNPFDKDIPYTPLTRSGKIVKPVQWFKDGTLVNLAHGEEYARKKNIANKSVDGTARIKVEFNGSPCTSEQMISSVQRGIWVHRIGGVALIDKRSLLITGITRDGTFLIENGKLSKPIKNMRFLESPFFVFSKVEAFGEAVRASRALMTPRIMVRDFEFTSLSDAV